MVEISNMGIALGIATQLIGIVIASVKISNAIDKRFDDLKQELNGFRLIYIGDISAQKGRIDVIETRLNSSDSAISRIERQFNDMHDFLVQNSDFKARR